MNYINEMIFEGFFTTKTPASVYNKLDYTEIRSIGNRI